MLCIVLTALLFVQARIALSDEIAIPGAVLRNLEQRMAERGMRFTFGAINCDSTGHVAVRDLKLFSSRHPDPVLAVQALRFDINPYMLWLHDVTPRRAARIDGATLRLPAMFSSDGTNAAVIDNINAELELKSSTLLINGLTARIGNLAITCRGSVVIPETRDMKRRGAAQFPEIIDAYLKIARQLDSWKNHLDTLDAPVLDITLMPDTGRIASARIELSADGLYAAHQNKNAAESGVPAQTNIVLGPLLASTSVDLADLFSKNAPAQNPRAHAPPLRIRFSTTEASYADVARVSNPQLSLAVPLADVLRLGAQSGGDPPPLCLSLAATADSITARDITGYSLMARARGQFPKTLFADATARVLGEPVAIETEADLAGKNALAGIATRVSPLHIEALSRELKYDLGAILKPARPIAITAAARLGSGWRFTGATGSLDIGKINARRVSVDRARGKFTYDHAKREILFSPATAVIGDSFARGSFWMNLDTTGYRFLLAGRLRPPSINGWLGAWWPEFWKSIEFEGAPPFGDVDVQGNFRRRNTTRVFVFADAAPAIYRGVPFDHVLLSLFVRPDYFDALDLFARRGGGHARGAFTHQRVDPGNHPLLTVLDFNAENIDPVAMAPAISPKITESLAPLHFEKPLARLRVAGRIDGPASPRGEHLLLDINAEGNEAFTYEKIPLKTLSANIRLRDDAIHFDRLETQFAGGRLNVKAQLSGTGAARRLGFDLNLNGANFAQTSQLLKEDAARRRGADAASKENHHKQPPGAQIDLRLSADGLLHDNLSYTGNGSAEITGAELVNVNLLGTLSQALSEVKMLNFTTLSLNNGQVNFTVDHRRMIIPEAILTGQKAQVKLSGEYTLDTRFANLTAKVYPLSESRGIIGKGLGFLLVPITHLTELKLTGSLDVPRWRFSYGPTSFFRALAGKNSDTESLEQEQAAKAGHPAPPQTPPPAPAPDNTVPETLRRPTDNG